MSEMIACPSCESATPSGFPRCANCGAPLDAAPSAREERKVVTVLFADLVGFTTRAERMDPEEVRALQAPYFARVRSDIERYGGTVEKFIGDAVMALFGAPVAHEDDPERAVRAALAIRDWIAEEQPGLQVRLACTTGEALISLGARPSEGEGMASGDVVNTAARLQSAAPPNGILVDETTYRATERAIEYREHASVEAKGKAEPLRVWEVAQARSRFGTDVRQIGRTPLVGREHELDVLSDALARTRREREPQLVTLIGVPGIGKSRLVWELFQRADAMPGLTRWRQGRSLPYGEGVAFWALGEMVKAEAGILETDSDDQAATKLGEMVRGLGVDEAEWLERHLRPLVALGTPEELGGDRRGEAFAAWRRFAEALADHRPTVFVFEDLHWADEGLLDFVDHLVDRASGVPLLVVGTARPELLARRPQWGGGKPNAITLSLSRLSDDDTARLVHALLDRSVLAADVQTSLLERAEGNPLYAEEFVRLVEERPGAENLPESVHGLIAARLDALTGEEKELVQDAAVYGKVFWLGGLVDGRTRWSVEELLHSLERKEFVRHERRSSVAGEVEYAFRHALVREVAYEQIPRRDRADKHLAAASWIESLGRAEDHSEMLGHHYRAAIDFGRAAGKPVEGVFAAARNALRAAGDRSFKLNAFAAAVGHYRAALELWPEGEPGRADVLFGLASALHISGADDAEETLETARTEVLNAGDKGRAAEASVMLAELWWNRGERTRVQAYLTDAQTLLESQPASPSKARVLCNVSRYLMLGAEIERAIVVGREAFAMAEALGLDELRAHALNNIGVARANLGDAGGLDDLRRSIEIARAVNTPELFRAYNNLAAVLGGVYGRMRESWELRRMAADAAEEVGSAINARFARGAVISDLYHRGLWEDHIAQADAYLTESAGSAGSYQGIYARIWRVPILLARGEDELALETARHAVERARASGDPQVLVPALGELARLHAELGNHPGALDAAQEVFRLRVPFPALYSTLALIADQVGIRDELLAQLTRAPAESLWVASLGALLSGDFVRAADLFREMGLVPYEAAARLRAAEQLVSERRRREADEQLDASLAFWRSVGATRYIREAESLLAATA